MPVLPSLAIFEAHSVGSQDVSSVSQSFCPIPSYGRSQIGGTAYDRSMDDGGVFFTVKRMLTAVNEADSLKSLRFSFRRNKRDSALITKPELLQWRSDYLFSIREFRASGRSVYYVDETWVNVGHTRSKLWHDDTIESGSQALKSGLSVGLTVPSGKGSRLIITHAGNEDGFVPGALDIFEGKKGKTDYHQEMDGDRFHNWFVLKLLPNLKPRSVIVMDNASYHSVQVERLPTTKWKKAQIQQWLTEKGIVWSPDLIVKDLLGLVDSVRSMYRTYNIDKIAEAEGHTVLRLPPYHCELNPIEMIWSQVKGYVAAQNKKFQISELRTLVNEGLSKITPNTWNKCVNHVIDKVETRFWTLDGMVNRTIEPFIITCGDSDSSSDSEEDEDFDPL